MDINNAIDKLNLFKKITKKVAPTGMGKCELINFDDNSFTVKITFDTESNKKPILGFSQEDQ